MLALFSARAFLSSYSIGSPRPRERMNEVCPRLFYLLKTNAMKHFLFCSIFVFLCLSAFAQKVTERRDGNVITITTTYDDGSMAIVQRYPCMMCHGSGACYMCGGTGVGYNLYGPYPCVACQGGRRCTSCGGSGFNELSYFVANTDQAPANQTYNSGYGGYSGGSISSSTSPQCKGCRGTGLCTSCKGTGKTKSSAYYTDGHTIISNCAVCNGTGRCGVCHGSGVIR